MYYLNSLKVDFASQPLNIVEYLFISGVYLPTVTQQYFSEHSFIYHENSSITLSQLNKIL